MNSTVHYTHCPACDSSLINPVLSARDYTVSGESFSIWQCANCSIRFTQDVPNIDTMGKYYKSENYISHTNTSKGLINRLYQIIRKKTLKRKRKLVSKIAGKKQGEILDVGSGTGAFVNEMKQNGWQVMGLEPDAGARKIAKEIFNCGLRDTPELFHLPENFFDVITLWHVLEHVHDLQNFLNQLKKILKSSGQIIIAVPNYTSLDASVYKEYWAAYDVPRHLYHFSPLAMEFLMKKTGMEIIEQQPMWFDSFYISLLSSKYKNARLRAFGEARPEGKTNWLASIIIGVRSNLKAMFDKKKCSSVIYIIRK